jgi:hypothetical protein
VRRSLWREDGSVVYNCCWPSPAQSFSGLSPVELATIFYCLTLEIFLFVTSYDSHGNGGCIWSPPSHGILWWFKVRVKVKITLRLTVIQSVSQSVSLGVEPHLGLMTRYLFLFDSYGLVFRAALSLTRVRVCLLYMLLALASAVFLGSEPLATSDHILLSQIWDVPFRRLLRLAGSRWRYSIPPPHEFWWFLYSSALSTFVLTVKRTLGSKVLLLRCTELLPWISYYWVGECFLARVVIIVSETHGRCNAWSNVGDSHTIICLGRDRRSLDLCTNQRLTESEVNIPKLQSNILTIPFEPSSTSDITVQHSRARFPYVQENSIANKQELLDRKYSYTVYVARSICILSQLYYAGMWAFV